MTVAVLAIVPMLALVGRGADDAPQVEPAAAKRDKVQAWRSADELPYEYYVPKSYEADGTGTMTLVLHGNGLDERWTFWNHPVGEFRPDDVLVSPDGTTFVQHMNNDEFLGNRKDADRLHALIEELREVFQPRFVHVYGHSQGSFFAFYYAGEYPDDVDGVLGHASGVWTQTKQSKKGHHQAIAFLHGTEDHIPYGQSWWGRKTYREADYPSVHLRTLFGWDHRPHHFQAALCLAWCDGMLQDDEPRLEAALDLLADDKTPMGMNLAALDQVARRVAEEADFSASLRSRAEGLGEKVDAVAQAVVAKLEKGLGKKGRVDRWLEDGKAAEELGLFLCAREELFGVPGFEAFLESRKKEIQGAEKAADKAVERFWKDIEKKPAAAVATAVELLEEGAIGRNVSRVVDRVAKLDLEDRELRLPKKVAGQYRALSSAYAKSVDEGREEFRSLVKKGRW